MTTLTPAQVSQIRSYAMRNEGETIAAWVARANTKSIARTDNKLYSIRHIGKSVLDSAELNLFAAALKNADQTMPAVGLLTQSLTGDGLDFSDSTLVGQLTLILTAEQQPTILAKLLAIGSYDISPAEMAIGERGFVFTEAHAEQVLAVVNRENLKAIANQRLNACFNAIDAGEIVSREQMNEKFAEA